MTVRYGDVSGSLTDMRTEWIRNSATNHNPLRHDYAMAIVAGVLRMPPGGGTYDRVRVSVRDVTQFDGPAQTVAVQDLPRVVVPDTGLELPFTLDADLRPGHTYVVRAHADRGGTGSVEPGDLVSTIAHEIGPAGRIGVVVPLQPVDGAK